MIVRVETEVPEPAVLEEIEATAMQMAAALTLTSVRTRVEEKFAVVVRPERQP